MTERYESASAGARSLHRSEEGRPTSAPGPAATAPAPGTTGPAPACSALDPRDLLQLVEYHLVIAGQEHDGSIVAELLWLAEQITDLANTVRLYGVNEACGLIATDHEEV